MWPFWPALVCGPRAALPRLQSKAEAPKGLAGRKPSRTFREDPQAALGTKEEPGCLLGHPVQRWSQNRFLKGAEVALSLHSLSPTHQAEELELR